MDIQTLKIDLVKKILGTQNEDLLLEINKIIHEKGEDDWWNELPKNIQESILEGIQDIEKGKLYTHDQVIQEAKQKWGL
jgi:hypothetical protein